MRLKKFLSALVSGVMVLGTLAAVPVFAYDFSEGAVADEAVTASNIELFSSITVDDTYVAKIGENEYTTLQEALAAAQDGDTVTLLSDVAISTIGEGNGLVPQISINKSITLDLAGHTIGYSDEVKNSSPTYTPAFFEIEAGVDVTITGNGKIDCEAGDNNAYGINVNGGSLTIENGTYLGALTAVQVQTGSLVIKDGTFDMATTCKAAVPQYAKYVVNAIDDAWKNGTAIISVEGGAFVGFDPSANPEGPGTTYVADSSYVKDNRDGIYTVAPCEAMIGETYYATLADALTETNQNGGKVTIINDCFPTEVLEVTNNVTIDGQNHTIDSSANRILWIASSEVTLNLKDLTMMSSKNTAERAIQVNTYFTDVNINIENCNATASYYTINITNGASATINAVNSTFTGWGAFNGWSAGYTATFDNCTLNGINDKSYDADGWNGFGTVVLEGDSTSQTTLGASNNTVNLNNCKITATATTGNKQKAILFNKYSRENVVNITGESTIIEYDDDLFCVDNGADNKLNITGGTFSSDVKDYVVNGYYSKANDNGTYTVVEAEATVIDTAKTTGATVTLDNLHTSNAVNPTDDATYQVVVETAPAADADAVNKFIEDSKKDGSTVEADNNTSKAMFDISVIKTDSNGTKSNVNVTNQPITLTLGETPSDPDGVRVYHVDGNNVTEIKRDANDKLTVSGNKVSFIAPSFSTYAVSYTAAPAVEGTITDRVGVVFSKVQNSSNQYYITLKSLDAAKKINRFMSADLVFNNNCGSVDYDITPAANMTASVVSENGTSREYRFNMDGTNQSCASSEIGGGITIGTITFYGYGELNFSVNTGYASGHAINIVNTATATNNIVASYTLDGGLLVNDDVTGNLADDEKSTIKNVTLAPEKKKLTVNVEYNNGIKMDNTLAYQDMTVTISGGDISGAKTVKLGKPGDSEVQCVGFAAGENVNVATSGNTYTITVDNELTQNVAYTVTVEGAGYRTARYTVNMAENKVLNFWNNVKDAAAYVEEGKDSSKTTKNFLAGDIVKDNQINIYDLSAVVSYFGSAATVDNNYAKYDLNRDGKIDSKDVAYVLVSWGK